MTGEGKPGDPGLADDLEGTWVESLELDSRNVQRQMSQVELGGPGNCTSDMSIVLAQLSRRFDRSSSGAHHTD
jgi:hypothetical protein